MWNFWRRESSRGISARLYLLISLTVLPLVDLLGWVCLQVNLLRREAPLATESEMAHSVAATFTAYFNDIRRQDYAIGQAILDTPAKATQVLSKLRQAKYSEAHASRIARLTPDALRVYTTFTA